MRINCNFERPSYHRFGLGVTFEKGNLGTTYGEEGWNMFREISIYLGPWVMNICWQFKSAKYMRR